MALRSLRSGVLTSSAALGAMVSLAAAPAVFAFPAPMSGQTLLFPAAGVVCDQPQQRCFDAQGLALGWTGQLFGVVAQQEALQRVNGRWSRQGFQLSDGSRCDLRQRICWAPSFGASSMAPASINAALTNQVFGTGSAAVLPAPVPAEQAYTGQCWLRRSGTPIVQGPCALNEVRQGYQPRFEVRFQNGPRYVFERSQDGYQISDGVGGRWLVQFSDDGNSGIFRWADLSLAVRQTNYRPESAPNSRLGRALGNFLIDLFN